MTELAPNAPTGIELYTRAAESAASAVIATYSTSFSAAVRFLAIDYRQHVANIYALVRVADEIVDGSAAEAGANSAKILDELEAEVYAAIKSRYSANLIVHAFANTANFAGIGKDLIEPFFHSMRMDLTEKKHDQKSFEEYIYGSAEVIGLMCLNVFLVGESRTDSERATLVAGARALGSAFQKVNFLRDLAADQEGLGRSYFPNLNPKRLTNAQRDQLVADIRSELSLAEQTLTLLPKGARRAVAAAHHLFQALNDKIAVTDAAEIMAKRIRVNDFQKALIATKVMLR